MLMGVDVLLVRFMTTEKPLCFPLEVTSAATDLLFTASCMLDVAGAAFSENDEKSAKTTTIEPIFTDLERFEFITVGFYQITTCFKMVTSVRSRLSVFHSFD